MSNDGRKIRVVESFNEAEFIRRAKHVDLEVMFKSKWDDRMNHNSYTANEKAFISYLTRKITPTTAPMLFNSKSKRMYTRDIPTKLIRYFDKELNTEPDENGWVPKTKVPLIARFCAENGITRTRWNNWCAVIPTRPGGERFDRAVRIANRYFGSVLLRWGLRWAYRWSFAALVAKNMLGMSDHVEIRRKVEVAEDKLDRIDNLSVAEIDRLIANPTALVRRLKGMTKSVIPDDIVSLNGEPVTMKSKALSWKEKLDAIEVNRK